MQVSLTDYLSLLMDRYIQSGSEHALFRTFSLYKDFVCRGHIHRYAGRKYSRDVLVSSDKCPSLGLRQVLVQNKKS